MNIHSIYHVYILYIHGIYSDVYILKEYTMYTSCIYMVYTWYIQWCLHIQGISFVDTMYIHDIYMDIMYICSTGRLMLRWRTGTCSTSNDIFLHSCEYLGFLAKWTCRARLELKIARALSSRVSCTTRASALAPAQILCWSQTWIKFL